MNKLILQLEVEEYLKDKSKNIAKELNTAFPGIGNIKVTINIWIGPPKEDKK